MEERFYCFTLKASANNYKGNKKLLDEQFELYLDMVGGIADDVVYECEGTSNVHLHALIRCPYIKNKVTLAKKLYGFSPYSEIIRKDELAMIKYIWFNYTHKNVKTISDSSRYTECFGNMFI